MKKTYLILAILILLSNIAIADDHSDKLEKIVNDYNSLGLFSGNVLIAKDGNIIFEKQYGYADWENKVPVTKETLFRIGSLNKMFTHTMIKQLEKEGKLRVNDNLGKYLKLYGNENDDRITIQMLIEMKAGLGDFLNDPEFEQNISPASSLSDLLNVIKKEPLLFEPGTGQEYSNSGYAVLGGIIETISGKSYKENLEERILKPLGMNNTFYLSNGENVINSSKGTLLNYKGEKISAKDIEIVSPAGGMWSNAEDLLKLDNELRKTGLIPPAIRNGGTPVWNSTFAQLKDGYTVIINSNFGNVVDGIIERYVTSLKGESYPPADYPLPMKLYKVLNESGTAGLKSSLKQIVNDAGMEYRAVHLNMFGYELMKNGELDKAIEVFTANTELFPGNPNVWDSLGEAYMNKGNNELAIANYKKSLELDPGNKNAKKMLEKLGIR